MRLSQGALLAAAAALTYGSLAVFAKLAYAEGWNVPSLLAVRFALASVCIVPFALRGGGSWRGFESALLVGAIGYTATTAFYFPSLLFLPAAVASFLLYLAPAFVMILAAFLLKERVSARGGAALALALLGLALLSSGALTGELSLLGIALAAASAVAYAATTVAGRSVAQRMPWARLSLGVCVGACASYVLFSTATGQLQVPTTPRALLWALGIGVLATGIPLSLFFAALGRASAGQVSVISTLEPVSTLVLALVVLGEAPGALGLVGGGLIVVAAALIASQVQVPTASPRE